MSAQLSLCVFVGAILSALFCRRYFIGAILHCAILSVNRSTTLCLIYTKRILLNYCKWLDLSLNLTRTPKVQTVRLWRRQTINLLQCKIPLTGRSMFNKEFITDETSN